MAERRMFAKSVVESDKFLNMPLSAQALYFHLCMNADDDGFVKNPQTICRMVGAKDDDFKILLEKEFVIVFESAVIVVAHWLVNNYIRSDRYKATIYHEEKEKLTTEKDGRYTIGIPSGYQLVDNRYTQDRLGKDSIGYKEKNLIKKESRNPSTKKTKHKHGEYNNVLLTDDELEKLKAAFPDSWEIKIQNFSEGLELKGYQYKSHYLAILNWDKREKEQAQKNKGYIDYSDTSRYENIKGW